jgi:hypothetical protein
MELLAISFAMMLMFLLGVAKLSQKRKRNDAFATHRGVLMEITGGTDFNNRTTEVEK